MAARRLKDLMGEATAMIDTVSAEDAQKSLSDDGVLFVDVREHHEARMVLSPARCMRPEAFWK
ncbi:MAG: hypothetical protein VB959_14975 [Rhodospirillales bacterium]|jgi:predicted sulfurtransferase